MAQSTAETLYDFIGEESGNAKPTGDATNQVSMHREFKLSATDGEQQLFLTFRDTETGTYHIPLGTLDSHEKTDSNNHENIIVPVIPLTYNTSDIDALQASVPREKGYIYIYKGDYLWRELQVLPNGKYIDVNLKQYQGKDSRPAKSADLDTRILMPYKIAGNSEILTMCYSEVQWSWSRINSMGGMDPYDFRINKKNPPLLAEAYGFTKDKTQENRNARMQEIDLSGHDSYFPNTPANGNKARVENSNSVSSTNYLLKAHSKSNIAVVYLHDPLGTALQNVHDYYDEHSNLINKVELIKMSEHYKSGVMAYHVFFNQELEEKVKKKLSVGHGQEIEVEVLKNQDESSKTLRETSENIDKLFLEENTLGVTERKILRQKIRDIKKRHVEFLEGKFDGKELKEMHSDFVSFNSAILDYAELPAPFYLVLWSAMHALIHFLNHDPSRLDSAFDLKKNLDKPKPIDDPGCNYMKNLLQPTHPLHTVLFPKKTDVDEYVEKYDIEGKKIEASNGIGEFRPITFAKSFAKLNNPGVSNYTIFESTIKQAERTLADIVNVFKQQWTESITGKITVEANVLVRLVKATKLSAFEGLHILKKGMPIDNITVMSGNVTILSQIIKMQKDNNITQDNKNSVKVIDPKTKKIVGYVDPKQIPNYKGMPMRATPELWRELFSTEGKSNFEMLVVSKTSKYSSEFNVSLKSEFTKTIDVNRTPSGIKFGGKILPPVVAVLELFNFVSAVNEFSNSTTKYKRIKSGSKTLLSFAGLLHASTTASVAIIGEEQTAKIMKRGLSKISPKLGKYAKTIITGSKTIRGVQIKNLASTGAVITGIGALMAGWDAGEAFYNDDDDAAAMYALQAFAFVGLAAAGIVEAGAVFLGMGPIGWAFLALGIIFGILAYLFTDTPLEQWAIHGPFSKNVDDRMTNEMSTTTKDASGKEITVPLSEHKTLEKLMGLLMQPKITIKKDTTTTPESIAVEMHAPGFQVGRSTLQVDCSMCDVRYTGRSRTTQRSDEKRLSPSNVSNIVDKESDAILGIKFNYTIPTNNGNYQFTARGRHITEEQIYIPRVIPHSHRVTLDKDDPRYRGSQYGKGQQKSVNEITSEPSNNLFSSESLKDKSWVLTKFLTVKV